MNELMDRVRAGNSKRGTRAMPESVAGVEYVEMFLRKMGAPVYVDMHVEVGSTNDRSTVARKLRMKVKDKIREQLPRVRDVLVHIEPAHDRPRHKSSGLVQIEKESLWSEAREGVRGEFDEVENRDND